MNTESKILLMLLKDITIKYNANNISKLIGVSSMGALKVLKSLEKKNIVTSEKFGKASIYSINTKNEHANDYLEFLLKSEMEYSSSYVKRWISELKKINCAEISILFGSVLKINEKANDIDVLFVIKQSKFKELKNRIEDLNKINEKKIHPIYQTIGDFQKNIKKKDVIVLNAIKGVFVQGHRKFLEVIEDLK